MAVFADWIRELDCRGWSARGRDDPPEPEAERIADGALASRTVSVLQPDIIQSGGLGEARKIAALAEMHFVSVAPHNPWSWVNTMASLHLDAVLPNFLMQEVISSPEPWKDEIVVNRPVMDDKGFFAVPTAPGLGISLDLEEAKRFPPVTGRPPALWHDDGSVADW